VKPAVPLDKGTAMQRFERETPTEWLSLYLGDDTTDEDAFRAIQPEGIGVHVGKRSDSAADYRIPGQSDVPDFLSWLTTRASISEEPGTS
jgi:trehalose 6-phosphate phosphatase